MKYSRKVEDAYKKCMNACVEADDQENTPIDIFGDAVKAEKGELRSYLIDDILIHTFKITPKELARYSDPQYAGYSSSSILEDLLLERRAKAEGNKPKSLFE